MSRLIQKIDFTQISCPPIRWKTLILWVGYLIYWLNRFTRLWITHNLPFFFNYFFLNMNYWLPCQHFQYLYFLFKSLFLLSLLLFFRLLNFLCVQFLFLDVLLNDIHRQYWTWHKLFCFLDSLWNTCFISLDYLCRRFLYLVFQFII